MLNLELSVIVIRKVCPFAVLPVYWEIKDDLFIYSVIKKNDVITGYNIWISVGMNVLNNDVDQNKNIYSRFQADKYMYRQFN